jgi:hypothetical protein
MLFGSRPCAAGNHDNCGSDAFGSGFPGRKLWTQCLPNWVLDPAIKCDAITPENPNTPNSVYCRRCLCHRVAPVAVLPSPGFDVQITHGSSLAWRAHAVEFLFGILDHLWLVEVERWCRLTRAAMFCPLGGGQMVKHKWLLFSYYTILLVFGVNINLLASCTTFRQSYPLNLILKYSLSFTVRDFFYSTGFRNCSRSSSSKFILYIN